MPKKIRVLIVDDSALMRAVLKRGLEKDPGLEVIGAAKDAYEARDLLVQHRPDVMTLDVEMPKLDGVTFLKKLMAVIPTPTVMVSSLTERGTRVAVEALEAGAVDVVAKPKGAGMSFGGDEMKELIDRVKKASKARLIQRINLPANKEKLQSSSDPSNSLIVIGSSTGGVAALAEVLPMFPVECPPIVIVQHMPAGFTAQFAKRLNSLCEIEVVEGRDGDLCLPGRAIIAPGGTHHTTVVRNGSHFAISLIEHVSGERHRPSVDVLFKSTADAAGPRAVGCILTGMGKDGSRGLLQMRQQGATTLAQDAETSVIDGMPSAAWKNGAAMSRVPLSLVASALLTSAAIPDSLESKEK